MKTVQNDMYTYEGITDEANEPNGFGSLYLNNDVRSLVYVGEWSHGNRHGHGNQHDRQHRITHTGTFEHNALVKGTYNVYTPNKKMRYDGDFIGGSIVRGKMYMDDELYYEGTFENELPSGIGVLYWGNGNIRYKGELKALSRQGKGESYFSSGQLEYFGDFQNDCKHGIGTYYDFDGKTIAYIGGFYRNDFHGQGTKYNKDGSVSEQGRFSFGMCMDKKPVINLPVTNYTDIVKKEQSISNASMDIPTTSLFDVNTRTNYFSNDFPNNRLFEHRRYETYQPTYYERQPIYVECNCKYSDDSIFVCAAKNHKPD